MNKRFMKGLLLGLVLGLVLNLALSFTFDNLMEEEEIKDNTLCVEYLRQDIMHMRRMAYGSDITEVKINDTWYNLEDVKASCPNK